MKAPIQQHPVGVICSKLEQCEYCTVAISEATTPTTQDMSPQARAYWKKEQKKIARQQKKNEKDRARNG